MMPGPRTIWLVALLSVALGCGDGNGGGGTTGDNLNGGGGGGGGEATDPGRPVSRQGTDAVTATMGSAGGTLELSNGAKLQIASGVLGSPTEITFALGAETQAFETENQRTIGPTLQVTPSFVAAPGTRVTLSVPFGSMPSGFSSDDLAIAIEVLDEEQRGLGIGGTQTRWELLEASVVSNRLTADLPEVTGMRLQFVAAR